MATTEPATRPPVESEEPEVTPSSQPTTPSPSPSPSPSTTSSPPPTTSSPPPTTAPSPSPSPSPSESEEPSTSSTTSTSTSTSTSSSTSSSTSTTPTTTSSSTSSSSSSSRPVETITSTVSQSRPGLVTSFSSVSRSSTVSGAAASSTGKGGVGGSGLPIGGLVGIIIGAIVALCLIALIVTRTIRKRARSRRTAHRTSMFEPWPAPVTMEEEDDIEKSRYSPPSQAYPMQSTGQYDYETYDVYGQAGVGAGAPAAAAAAYPPSNGHSNEYQYAQQDYNYGSQQGHDYNQQPGVPPPVTGGTAATMGLRDGMMTRVQVGFNRTLEDELAITPGQQLWLHNVYDDGWAMCEDQNQHRGVVPITSLVPWTDDDPNHLSGMSRSHTGESLSGQSQRRSSLYANVQAGTAYLNQPQ